MSERDLFLSALDLPPADRPAFLDRACGDNQDLRRKVDGLLAAHAAADSFLEHPNPGPAADGTAAVWPSPLEGEGGTARPGPVTGEGNETHDMPADPDRTSHHSPQPDAGAILGGKYKLVEPIGEGGMGTVWMAQQTEPVKRVVAVKLIKAGMDSRAVLARFEAERQALAMMDHPNIAKVLDAGATPDGRPYFVMELVKGVPITAFCDARKLTPRQRLELFVPVCQAVQHAHQKGVIHRDLKPSNVLVALYDDRPVPKVIDFGVAKAAGSPLTDKTLLTGFGAVVGTPAYMSPEQASFNQLDVDTRSDVYSLGVLLYELLAGSPPFARKELERAGLLEVLRVIREEDPPRPSLKLSSADTLATIAANRGTEPRRLAGLVRGELDWIVMRALEKDRGRRYDTAAGFAADVGRYLSGEPVAAVPPSAGYRLRKFVRRNRAAVLVAAGFLLLTWAGSSGIYFAYRRAVAAETAAVASAIVANDERDGKERALREAIELRHQAERQYWLTMCDLDREEGDYPWRRRTLLRLARTLQRIPAEHQELREHASLNIVMIGQEVVSLCPDTLLRNRGVSRDGRLFLTRAKDGAVEVRDTLSDKVVVALRPDEFDEGAFTPDGSVVVTYSLAEADGLHVRPARPFGLRAWRLPDGTQLAADKLPAGTIDFVRSDRAKARERGPGDRQLGSLGLTGDGKLVDLSTGREQLTPPGRKYHPEFRQFATGGRLLWLGHGLLDLAVERDIGPGVYNYVDRWITLSPAGEALQFWSDVDGAYWVAFLPSTTTLPEPRVLELWVKVMVRGEITRDNQFVAWDELNWQQHRDELMRVARPMGSIPFPGPVAHPLYWLRREWLEGLDADRPQLAAELLRRAELLGDSAEAIRWRLELDKHGPHVAPPPREVRR